MQFQNKPEAREDGGGGKAGVCVVKRGDARESGGDGGVGGLV